MVGSRDVGFMESEDFYETPPEATRALLTQWRPPGAVWEPACGKGAISRVLEEQGITVISTDLVDRGYGFGGVNFFDCEGPIVGGVDTIVTNPPYNISTDFVEHACKIVPVSAFLLRLAWLEGVDRHERIFSHCPLARVMVFSKRIPRMHRPDYEGKKYTSTIAFAWFLFDAGHLGRPEISWI